MGLNREKGLDNLLKNEAPGSFFVPTQQIDYSVGVISTARTRSMRRWAEGGCEGTSTW